MCSAFCLLHALVSIATEGFESREVSVRNERAGINLAGTLTVPSQGDAKAALVMVTGSGQQDRDETIFGQKPFKAIAEYLSDKGYAVLRLDDRGVGKSEGDPASCTTDDFADDAAYAFAWLDSCFNTIPAGFLGHSEGGSIAIKNAVAAKGCDFIITIGAPAFPGDSIILSQSKMLCEAQGMPEQFIKVRDEMLPIYSLLKSPLPNSVVMAQLNSMIYTAHPEYASLPQAREAVDQQIAVLSSPWYRAFLRYNPEKDIREVKCPWLAINGNKDLQVTPDNLEYIRSLNPEAETVLLDGHNHLLQEAVTGLPTEYATLPHSISPQALETIEKWLAGIADKP